MPPSYCPCFSIFIQTQKFFFFTFQKTSPLIVYQPKKFYLDDSDEASESNSPEFPHPPHEINIFKSGFFSFNFIIPFYNVCTVYHNLSGARWRLCDLLVSPNVCHSRIHLPFHHFRLPVSISNSTASSK